MSDYRWQVLEDARSALTETFLPEGVVRVEYVAAFPDQAPFAVWLGTETGRWRALFLRTAGAGPSLFVALAVGSVWAWTRDPVLVLNAAAVSAVVLTAIRRTPPGSAQ